MPLKVNAFKYPMEKLAFDFKLVSNSSSHKYEISFPLYISLFFFHYFSNVLFRYLFGMIDVATNRLWIKAMTNRTAQAVLDYVRTEVYKKEEALVKELQNENIQLRAHTDNGKEFVAAIISMVFFSFFFFLFFTFFFCPCFSSFSKTSFLKRII